MPLWVDEGEGKAVAFAPYFFPKTTVQRTPDEIYDELRELRQTAEQIAENIAEVASAIQYFTNNLFDQQHHPELAQFVQELSVYLHRVAAVANEQAAIQVERTAEVVEEAVNGVLQQQDHAGESQDNANDCECSQPTANSLADVPTSSELPKLPEMFAWRLEGLVKFLQVEAGKLAACDHSGQEAVWGWWERHFEGLRDALMQLEFLEEKAVGEGMTLVPYIEQLGGVPETILADQWPEEMVAAVEEFDQSEETSVEISTDASFASKEREGSPVVLQVETKQQALFGEEQDENPAVDIATELHDTNGHSTSSSPLQVTEAVTSKPNADAPLESREPQTEDVAPVAETHHQRPYTIDDLQSFQERFENQQINATQLKSDFHRLLDSRQAIIETLIQANSAKQLKAQASRCGSCRSGRQTKAENAAAIFRSMTTWFNLHRSVRYSPCVGETHEDALAKMIEEITDDDLQDFYRQNSDQQAAYDKALENPETLTEFCTFVRVEGEDTLSDEQHLRRDRLYADRTRQTRIEQKSNSVQQFQSDQLDGLEFSIKEGFHEKRQCPLWIVQLLSRVDRSSYGELKVKAKQLGGWYSSFKKTDAGFQFLTEEAAHKFVGLKEGDADRSEELEDRRVRKIENAGQRFAAMADRLTEQSEQTLEADDSKLKNTHRRAEQAASARAGAYESLATAKTLRSLATGLQEGEVVYLDGIRYAVQIETLRSILRRARWAHINRVMETEHGDLSIYERSIKQDELEQREMDASDVRYATYPRPSIYRGHLERAFAQLENTKGAKQSTAKMRKLVGTAPKDKENITFSNDHAIEMLEDFLGRAKVAGYSCYWFEHCLNDHKRLRAANIHDSHELRAALAELLPHISSAEGDDPVTLAIDELRGKKLDCFFPTPRPIILQMLDMAYIQGDDRVLEPSAGMGNILDAIRAQHPEVDLKAVEQNRTLAGVLAAKGYAEITTFGDFLEHQGPYDRILMNPPFEKSAEIEHVRHAHDLLSVGGRLVSVMSKGPFFRSDSKSREFREWLDGLDHEVEELPEGAFQSTHAFRQTGVQTMVVAIDKTN